MGSRVREGGRDGLERNRQPQSLVLRSWSWRRRLLRDLHAAARQLPAAAPKRVSSPYTGFYKETYLKYVPFKYVWAPYRGHAKQRNRPKPLCSCRTERGYELGAKQYNKTRDTP